MALLAMCSLGLGLRASVTALASVHAILSVELSVDAGTLTALGALVPLCFAAGSVVGPALARAASLEGALLVAAACAAAATLARALAVDGTMLVATSILAFFAIGVENVLVPPLIKSRFPRRIGPATALCSGLTALGSALPPLVAVFVPSGWWRAPLFAWALLAAIAIVPCAVLYLRRETAKAAAPRATAARPRLFDAVRSGVAWRVTLPFAVSAVFGYFFWAWLPAIGADIAGLSPAAASLLLGLYSCLGIPVYVVGPLIVTRLRHPGVVTVAAAGAFVVACTGTLLAPQAIVVWVILLGIGQVLFPVAVTLVNVRTETLAGSITLSSFMQLTAYLLGAGGALALGQLFVTTGSWTPSLLCLLAVAVAAGLVGGAPGSRSFESDLRRASHQRASGFARMKQRSEDGYL